jgi:hypothetical protein
LGKNPGFFSKIDPPAGFWVGKWVMGANPVNSIKFGTLYNPITNVIPNEEVQGK